MSPLRKLINDLGLANLTAQEIVNVLNTKSETRRHEEPITSSQLVELLGPDLASQAIAAFKQVAANDPFFESQWQKLNSTGLNFGHPLTQQFIDQLVAQGAFTPELGDQLKALGVKQLSPYEIRFGEGQTVTLEQVQQALSETPKTEREVMVVVTVSPTKARANARAIIREDNMYSGEEFSYSLVDGKTNFPPDKQAIIDQIIDLARQL